MHNEKDVSEKTLETYDDVFADIINTLLFEGEQVVKPEELVPATEYSMYKADGEVHEQERDCAKLWTVGKVNFCLFGLENQTGYDKMMPARIINYDGAEYRKQLIKNDDAKRNKKKMAPIYPVITLVLYFGKRKWKNKTLYDCIDMSNTPDCLRRYVSDYNTNVFDISHMSEKQKDMFQSDFRLIADYFIQVAKGQQYVPESRVIQHEDATFKCLKALTKDTKWVSTFNDVKMKKGGSVTMCDVVDGFITQGVAQGITQGITQGIAQGITQGEDIAISEITKAKTLIKENGYTTVEDLVNQGIPEKYARVVLL